MFEAYKIKNYLFFCAQFHIFAQYSVKLCHLFYAMHSLSLKNVTTQSTGTCPWLCWQQQLQSPIATMSRYGWNSNRSLPMWGKVTSVLNCRGILNIRKPVAQGLRFFFRFHPQCWTRNPLPSDWTSSGRQGGWGGSWGEGWGLSNRIENCKVFVVVVTWVWYSYHFER